MRWVVGWLVAIHDCVSSGCKYYCQCVWIGSMGRNWTEDVRKVSYRPDISCEIWKITQQYLSLTTPEIGVFC